VIGAGSVGATVAYTLCLKKVASRLLLVDIDERRCSGEVADLQDCSFLSSVRVGMGSYKDAGQCDIVVITAGAKQKPGESRVQLINRNNSILKSVCDSMKPMNPNCILLVVANPVDVLAYYALRYSGLPAAQVIGSGTSLDTDRLRRVLADEYRVQPDSVHAYVLGEHGDSQLVAWSSATIGGVALDKLWINIDEKRTAIAEGVKRKAYEIIDKKGATYYGIGAAVSVICESILFAGGRVLPVSVHDAENDVYISRLAILSRTGVDRVLPLVLNEEESQQFAASVKSLKRIISSQEEAESKL